MALKIFPATTFTDQDGKLKKVPLIRGWQKLATDDPSQIEKWKQEFGEHLKIWGLPTGRVNGIVAVDIDVRDFNGFISLQQQGLTLPPTFSQTTPTGGKHFVYKYPDNDVHIGNTVSSFGKEIDTRGEGGWIACYKPDNNLPFAEPPSWLVEGARKIVTEKTEVNWKYEESFAREYLKELALRIEHAPAGSANDTMNLTAFEASQELLSTNSLSRDEIFDSLYDAAIKRGKPTYEATATITSGLEGGLRAGPKFNFIFGEFTQMEPPKNEDDIIIADNNWDLVFGTNFLSRPQLIQHWSNRDIMILSADGGTGKSTMLLNEAICSALGYHFLGLPCVNPNTKTLFFLGEDSCEKYQQMMGRMMIQMNLTDDEKRHVMKHVKFVRNDNYEITMRDKVGNYYPNQKWLDKTFKLYENFNFDKAVYDPIASFWGREADLNDMAKGVIKFVQKLKDQTNCGIEMVNHIGKSSSQNRDASQFAGRGGSGLPSHARIVKTMYSLTDDEWNNISNDPLDEKEMGVVIHVGKFTDFSPLMKSPMYAKRTGSLFQLVTAVTRKKEDNAKDVDLILPVIELLNNQNTPPTKSLIIAQMKLQVGMSKDRVNGALEILHHFGHNGKKIDYAPNPDITKKDNVIVIK